MRRVAVADEHARLGGARGVDRRPAADDAGLVDLEDGGGRRRRLLAPLARGRRRGAPGRARAVRRAGLGHARRHGPGAAALELRDDLVRAARGRHELLVDGARRRHAGAARRRRELRALRRGRRRRGGLVVGVGRLGLELLEQRLVRFHVARVARLVRLGEGHVGPPRGRVEGLPLLRLQSGDVLVRGAVGQFRLGLVARRRLVEAQGRLGRLGLGGAALLLLLLCRRSRGAVAGRAFGLLLAGRAPRVRAAHVF